MTTEWQGEAYAAINGLQRELARRSLASIAWRGDERVLDVGCGDGAVSAQIADAVPRGSVLGIDASPSQIAFAARHNARTNITYAVGDATALGLAAAFDAVVSFNTLHWVHDLETAFRELRRACVLGAQLAVRMVGQSDWRSFEQTLMDTAAASRWRDALGAMERPFEHRPPDELIAIGRAAGFEATLDVEDVEWDFGSRQDFVAWGLGTMRPWTTRLGEDERESFVRDAADAFAKDTGKVGVFRFRQCSIRGLAI